MSTIYVAAFVTILLVVSEPVKICALNKFEHIRGPNSYNNLWTGTNLLFCPVPNCIHNSFKPTEVKYCIKYNTNTKTSVSFESRTIRVVLDWIESSMRKNIFTCLFSVYNTISLARHEQGCLIRLRFERYFSHPQQRKWLCCAYLKEICGPGRKQ